ncbi:MAG: 1-acyl-sn-glycerol-3-phosphate acyltransferase [Treponema sp.]|jgi:1-acyl-sn-glycerol-3-phosphate acyltransferase|nr:1-acyl-sn-glycerol-3-phosphate acyltransferase [Treponema sp.]
MKLIKTVFCFTVLVLVVILLTPVGFLVVILSPLGLKKPLSVMIYRIVQGCSKMLILFTGNKPEVVGRENIPPKGGLCIVSNHDSIFDILLLVAYTGRPIGFITKKELLLIPFLNILVSMLGGLYIDRKNIRSAVRTINKGIERIKAGGCMLIFPEGHRSRGRGLLPFHSGSLKLATRALAPIVPVAIAGSYRVFEKTYRVEVAPLKLVFGKPINTVDIPAADRKQLSNHVYAVIREALSV